MPDASGYNLLFHYLDLEMKIFFNVCPIFLRPGIMGV